MPHTVLIIIIIIHCFFGIEETHVQFPYSLSSYSHTQYPTMYPHCLIRGNKNDVMSFQKKKNRVIENVDRAQVDIINNYTNGRHIAELVWNFV